jgi:hypothetical protein
MLNKAFREYDKSVKENFKVVMDLFQNMQKPIDKKITDMRAETQGMAR